MLAHSVRVVEQFMKQRNLSGRELAAAVAGRVMGWSLCWLDRFYGAEGDWSQRPVSSKAECKFTPIAYWREPNGRAINEAAEWLPSESIEAAMQVEDRIAELGLHSEYLRALADVAVFADATWNAAEIYEAHLPWGLWPLVHATAEQRCHAALAATDAGKHE